MKGIVRYILPRMGGGSPSDEDLIIEHLDGIEKLINLLVSETKDLTIIYQKALINVMNLTNCLKDIRISLYEIEKDLNEVKKGEESIEDDKHWLIRVKDGVNFKNSIPNRVWGFRDIKGQKTIIKKFKKGDILWFIMSKTYGGKVVGMAEFEKFYDRKEELLVSVNTLIMMRTVGTVELIGIYKLNT